MPTQVLLLAILTAAVASLGCNNNYPDPATTAWAKIEVNYCVGSPPTVTMKSWATEDQGLLNDLHDAFKIKTKRGLSLVGTMTTNCIELRLADGKAIVMYVLGEERLTSHNPANRKQSYSLTTEKGFVGKLRDVIQAATGETVHFYYRREVTISR